MLNKLFNIIGRMSGKANLTFFIYGFLGAAGPKIYAFK